MGVNAASIVEIFNAPSEITRTAVPAQVSGQPPQTFKESLLAASSVPVSPRPANETSSASRQTKQAVPVDAKLPTSAPLVRDVPPLLPSPQAVQTQVSLLKQPPLIRSAIIPTQLPLGKPVLAAGDRVLHAAAAKLTEREVVKPESIKPNHSSSGITPRQVVPALPSVTLVSQVVTNLSTAATKVVEESVATRVPNPSSAVALKTEARGANKISSVPGAVTSIVADAVPLKAPSALPAEKVPSADPGMVPTPTPKAVADAVSIPLPNADPGMVPTPTPKAVADVVPSPLPNAVPGMVPTSAPNSIADVVASPLPNAVPQVVLAPALKPVTSITSGMAPATVTKTHATVVSDDVPRPVPTIVPGLVEKAAAPVVPLPIPNPSSPSVLHAAANPSVRQEAAPKISSGSAVKTAAPAEAPTSGGVATGLSAPGVAIDPLVAAIQPPAAKSADILAAASITAANGKDAVSKAESNAIGLKQHASPASDQQALQTDSQGTATASDQSPGQGQGGATQQDPSGNSAAAAAPPASFVNHTIAVGVDHAQNAADIAGALPAAPTPAGPADHTAKAPETAAVAATALPQPAPVINTARLIQSMGQSDMRVGMRSHEFGNISINTSATRDLISAQISLDHSELARTLATHVPEMQAKLGGNQAMDVRIDMNGQGLGTSAGMSEGSGDGSRGDRQQRGNSGSSQPSERFVQGSVAAAAAMPAGEVKLNTRLDIRA